MFTTASWSGNSNRCGTLASRSLGPMSGSVLMIVNTLSMTSRNSAAELKLAIAGESNRGRRVPLGDAGGGAGTEPGDRLHEIVLKHGRRRVVCRGARHGAERGLLRQGLQVGGGEPLRFMRDPLQVHADGRH